MIADARLYFVCDAHPGGRDPSPLLQSVIEAGVDAVQLREKAGGDAEILAAAGPFRQAAGAAGIPFIVNDRAELVSRCDADGVHVGQSDVAVARARVLAGPEAIIGLSTHNAEQLTAANEADGDDRPDYISVGPVWETPTKPGRPAAGLDYVRLAARESELPWFAIGGIDESNIDDVIDAGATRVVVVRAIRDANDPAAVTRALREALDRNS